MNHDDHETGTRLALVEKSITDLTELVRGMANDLRQTSQVGSDVAVLRADIARYQHDLLNISVTATRDREAHAQDVASLKQEIGINAKEQEETVRRLWFWQGAAWGAGAVIGLTVGMIVYIAKDTITSVAQLREDMHRIELIQQRRE